MARYHQPYSEVRKMPMRLVEFLLALIEAEDQYEIQKIEELKRKGNR